MTTSIAPIETNRTILSDATCIAVPDGSGSPSVTNTSHEQDMSEHGKPLSFINLEPNDESLSAIRETEEMIRTGLGESCATAQELIEAALA